MARINISITDELKSRMDQHPGFNWSEIASKAFNNQILITESSIEVKNMTVAISRLKASKQMYKEELKTQGYEEGHSWAMEHAEYSELRRLSEWDKLISSSSRSAPMSANEFMDAVTDQGLHDVDVFEDDAPIHNDEYISGFCAGALAVFKLIEESD